MRLIAGPLETVFLRRWREVNVVAEESTRDATLLAELYLSQAQSGLRACQEKGVRGLSFKKFAEYWSRRINELKEATNGLG